MRPYTSIMLLSLLSISVAINSVGMWSSLTKLLGSSFADQQISVKIAQAKQDCQSPPKGTSRRDTGKCFD